MPNKDPNLIAVILKYILESPFFYAAVTAIARGLYAIFSVDENGKANYRAIMLDAFLCAMLTIFIIPLAEYASNYLSAGLPERADVALAVFVGYIGQKKLSELIIKGLARFVGAEKNE